MDVEFCSDCGNLRQTVSVERDAGAKQPGRSLGRWFRSTIRRVVSSGTAEPETDLSEGEQQALVQSAFQQIEPRLKLEGGQWVRSVPDTHPSEPFDQQLRDNPIRRKYDIEVLIRVLLEVSRSDSDLRTEERLFLEEIVPDQETIKKLSQSPPITVAELAETSSVPVKETILMLAWAMAYADGTLDPEEMQHINQLCRSFMLPEARVRELQLTAKLFLLDRHFHNLRGTVPREQLCQSFEEKGQEWGLSDEQLSTLRSWYPHDFEDSVPKES